MPNRAHCDCGKVIDPDEYVSIGDVDYCSDMCAEKKAGKQAASENTPIQQFVGDFPAAAFTPS